jgi:hypothetical protein
VAQGDAGAAVSGTPVVQRDAVTVVVGQGVILGQGVMVNVVTGARVVPGLGGSVGGTYFVQGLAAMAPNGDWESKAITRI